MKCHHGLFKRNNLPELKKGRSTFYLSINQNNSLYGVLFHAYYGFRLRVITYSMFSPIWKHSEALPNVFSHLRYTQCGTKNL